MRVARALVIAVEQLGVSRTELLRPVGITPEQLEQAEARLTRATMAQLTEHAMDLARDDAFGLHWAERQSVGAFGPMSHLLMYAPTLREGFASLDKFAKLLTDNIGFEVVEDERTVTIRRIHAPGESARMQRFASEMLAVSFYRIFRFSIPGKKPECVCFDYPAPVYHEEYRRLFGDEVLFGHSFTGVVFDRAVLDIPAPHRDADAHEALQTLAERRLLRITARGSYALRVRELLVRQGSPQQWDMDVVARTLSMSARSLRRRLAAEGRSYSSVVDEALAMVAKHLIANERLSIQETAYELGFSDTSTFHRAFKRCTGVTPAAFREGRAEKVERE